MLETMIYAPGCNDAVLLRTMALRGRQWIGVRVTDSTELAQFALMRSGVSVGNTLLDPQEAALILKQNMTGEYFRSASLADAEQLRSALYAVRMLIPENERETLAERLPKGPFPEKNREILRVYEAYLAACADRKAIDSIMLMRLAAEKAKPLKNAAVLVPETVHLTPLERALLVHLFGESGVRCVSLAELFGKERKPLILGEITACYGASTEVRHILAQIAKNKYPFDSCTVAVTDLSQYAPLFREIAAEYGVPLTVRTGIPLRDTAPARLFRQVCKWQEGLFGTDAFRELILCDAFDRTNGFETLGLPAFTKEQKELSALIGLCGALRLSMDADENRERISECRKQTTDPVMHGRLNAAETLMHCFEQGYQEILRTFSVVNSPADAAARRILCDASARSGSYDSAYTEEFMSTLLDKTVGADVPQAGAVFLTDLSFAPEALREHMFLAGMSADLFPGNIPENYFMLDADLLAVSEEHAQTSECLMMHRKTDLEALVRLLSACDIRAEITYSDFQTAELKDANASSVLFSLWQMTDSTHQEISAFRKEVKQIGYFAEPISETDRTGWAYMTGGSRAGSAFSPGLSGVYTGARVFSPTKIEVFLECPYQFMLQFLLKAEVPEEDDVFTVIPANELGSLIHAQFEMLADHPDMTQAAFEESVRAAFAAYSAGRPPVHERLKEKTLSEIMEMVRHGYELIHPEAVFAAEHPLLVLHEASGITLKGTVDRVETAQDGTLTVLDYKTGKTIRHQANDPESCIQTMLYAYMIEHDPAFKGKTVSNCKYLYLRDGAEIACEKNTEIVDSVLGALREALDTGVFPRSAKPLTEEPCRYCPYKTYCGKEKQ